MVQQEGINMKHPEEQYLNIIRDIMDNGTWKEPARAGMPRTKEVFFRTMLLVIYGIIKLGDFI